MRDTMGEVFVDDELLDCPPPDASERVAALAENRAAATADAPSATARLSCRSLDAVAVERTDWLWYGRIALGTLTVVSGAPGDGKSTILADIAARVTTGARWPFSDERAPLGRVVAVNVEEDPARTIRPRFEAANGDPSRFTLIERVFEPDGTPRLFDLNRDLHALESLVRDTDTARLVLLDPLGPLMGETDSHRHSETYAMLAPLATLAQTCGVAVVVVSHTRKLREGSAIDRLMGSRAFSALPRNVLCVMPEAGDAGDDGEGDDAGDEVRLFAHAKASLSRKQPALRFTIGEAAGRVPFVEWLGELADSADDVLRAQEGANGGKGERQTAIKAAAAWLREELRHGPRLSKDVDAKAAAEGIAVATLKRAKPKLGVLANEQRDEQGRVIGWSIRLPGHPDPEAQGLTL